MNKKTEIKRVSKIHGHIILLCKGHYHDNIPFLDAIRKVWAARCGYDHELNANGSSDEFIANELYEILTIIEPERMVDFSKKLHCELCRGSYKQELKPIERIIYIYRSHILGVCVKKIVNGRYKKIINLPKPNKVVFKRIIEGNALYDDYKLIT
jgi:hypothetical protein